MNPEKPSREEIELKLTALLLGELPAEETRLLHWAISQDAELAKLHDRLKLAIGFVREAAATPAEANPPLLSPLKLSGEKRDKLLAHFKTVRPVIFLPPLKKRRDISPFLAMAAAIALIAVLAAMLLPALAANKRKAQRITLLSGENASIAESDKEQFAVNQHLPVPAAQSATPPSALKTATSERRVAGLEAYIQNTDSSEKSGDRFAESSSVVTERPASPMLAPPQTRIVLPQTDLGAAAVDSTTGLPISGNGQPIAGNNAPSGSFDSGFINASSYLNRDQLTHAVHLNNAEPNSVLESLQKTFPSSSSEVPVSSLALTDQSTFVGSAQVLSRPDLLATRELQTENSFSSPDNSQTEVAANSGNSGGGNAAGGNPFAASFGGRGGRGGGGGGGAFGGGFGGGGGRGGGDSFQARSYAAPPTMPAAAPSVSETPSAKSYTADNGFLNQADESDDRATPSDGNSRFYRTQSSDSGADQKSKIPMLGDVPLNGNLFANSPANNSGAQLAGIAGGTVLSASGNLESPQNWGEANRRNSPSGFYDSNYSGQTTDDANGFRYLTTTNNVQFENNGTVGTAQFAMDPDTHNLVITADSRTQDEIKNEIISHAKAAGENAGQNGNQALGFDWYLGGFDHGKVAGNGGSSPSLTVPSSAPNPLSAFPRNPTHYYNINGPGASAIDMNQDQISGALGQLFHARQPGSNMNKDENGQMAASAPDGLITSGLQNDYPTRARAKLALPAASPPPVVAENGREGSFGRQAQMRATKAYSVPATNSVDQAIPTFNTTAGTQGSPGAGSVTYTRTFKVNPDTFYSGLQGVSSSTFGATAGTAGGGNSGAGGLTFINPSANLSDISTTVQQLFTSLGITTASVAFNNKSGYLYVLATDKNLDAIERIVQTLNQVAPPVYAPNGRQQVTSGGQAQMQATKLTNAIMSSTDEERALPKIPQAAPIPQPEILTGDNAFSTFSLNVSDVSFELAKASLQKNVLPEAASIRSEEFINAFDYHDPEPLPGVPVAFASERVRDPFANNRDLLRFSIKTAAAGRQPGRPLNIVLLLDDSGSMERADRVAIIHEALKVLASQLQPQDTLSIVTFARTARLWVDGVSGDQAQTAVNKVSGLTPEGGTNLEEAMNLAYATARRHYLANGVNRVVLLTDGAANLGNVDPEALKQKVESFRKQGIALDCFGIGFEDYNDDLLEVLSSNGDGRYAFINSPGEAVTEFAAKLAGALQVAAEDVKVQVEFNPQRVISWRQIGYAKHQLTKEQFRDNTVAAAPLAAREAGNALYTVEINPQGEGPVATVRVRFRVPGTQDVSEHAWDVPFNGAAPALENSSPAMRLAATAGEFSEWLASSPFAQEVTPDELLNDLRGVPQIYSADPRPKQLETMIREAKSLMGSAQPAPAGTPAGGFGTQGGGF